MTRGPLRIGIAGYGVVGKRRRVHIDEDPRLRTVAVCDQTFPATGAMADGVHVHRDYRALLDERLDAVFVSLPNYLAPDVTIAGMAM